MSEILFCDHCGKRIGEGDLASGKAVKSRGDLLCSECDAMYAAEERSKAPVTAKSAPSAPTAPSRPSAPAAPVAPVAPAAAQGLSVRQMIDNLPRKTRLILAFSTIGLVFVLLIAGVLVAIAVGPDKSLEGGTAAVDPEPLRPIPSDDTAADPEAMDADPGVAAEIDAADPDQAQTSEAVEDAGELAAEAADRAIGDAASGDEDAGVTQAEEPPVEAEPEPVVVSGQKIGWTLALDYQSQIDDPPEAKLGHGYLALSCTLALEEKADDVVALGPPAELMAQRDEEIVVATRSRPAELLWLADGQKTRSFTFNVAYRPGLMKYVDSAKVDVITYRGVERLSVAWDDPGSHLREKKRMGEYSFTIRDIQTSGHKRMLALLVERDENALPAIYRWRILCEDGSAVTGSPTLSTDELKTTYGVSCDGPRPSRLEIEMATDVESSTVNFVLSTVELPEYDGPPPALAEPTPLPDPVESTEPVQPPPVPEVVRVQPPPPSSPAKDESTKALSVVATNIYAAGRTARDGIIYGSMRCEGRASPVAAGVAAVEYPSYLAPETDQGIASVKYGATSMRVWLSGTTSKYFASMQMILPETATKIVQLDADCTVYLFEWEETLKWDDPAKSLGTTKSARGISFTLIGCEMKDPVVNMQWRAVMPNNDRAVMMKVTQVLKPNHTSDSQCRILKSSGTAIEFSERCAASDGPPQATWITMRGLTGRMSVALSASDIPISEKQRLDPPVELGTLVVDGTTPLAPVSREIVSNNGIVVKTKYSTAEAQKLVTPLPITKMKRLSARPRRKLTAAESIAVNEIIGKLRSSASSRSSVSARSNPTVAALKTYDMPQVTQLLEPLITYARNSSSLREFIDVLRAHDNRESARQLLSLAAPDAAQGVWLNSSYIIDYARTALFALRDFQAIEWLYTSGLQSRSEARRELAAQALAEAGEERSVPYLRRSLRDQAPGVRSAAAIALGRMRDEGSLKDIKRLTREQMPYIRSSAILALGALGGDEATDVVVSHLKDKAFGVRRAAVQACGALRTPAAIEALSNMLYQCPEQIKSSVLRSLIAIVGKHLGDNPLAWKQWWKDTKDNYSPPSIAAIAAAIAQIEEEGASYYGIKMYGKQLAFVIDVSGSMTGQKLDGVKSELKAALGRLTPKHKFCMIFFETSVKPWRSSLAPAAPNIVRAAMSYVENLQASGGTNLYDALVMALGQRGVDTIYLLSDGQPSSGAITDTKQILTEVRKINMGLGITINCIGLGSHDRSFMEALADENGGRYVSP